MAREQVLDDMLSAFADRAGIPVGEAARRGMAAALDVAEAWIRLQQRDSRTTLDMVFNAPIDNSDA